MGEGEREREREREGERERGRERAERMDRQTVIKGRLIVIF